MPSSRETGSYYDFYGDRYDEDERRERERERAEFLADRRLEEKWEDEQC